jgi:hypothetical protein
MSNLRPDRRSEAGILFACDRANEIGKCQSFGKWWSQTGSNRRPHACKARALPTELWPLKALSRELSSFRTSPTESQGPKGTQPRVGSVVGPGRLELPTSRLSGVCSNQLSYRPLKRSARSRRSQTDMSWDRARRARDHTARPQRSAVSGKRNEDGGRSAPVSVFGD